MFIGPEGTNSTLAITRKIPERSYIDFRGFSNWTVVSVHLLAVKINLKKFKKFIVNELLTVNSSESRFGRLQFNLQGKEKLYFVSITLK